MPLESYQYLIIFFRENTVFLFNAILKFKRIYDLNLNAYEHKIPTIPASIEAKCWGFTVVNRPYRQHIATHILTCRHSLIHALYWEVKIPEGHICHLVTSYYSM